MGFIDSISNCFVNLNPFQLIWFTQKINRNFGTRLTLLLSSVYYGPKGVGYYFAKGALLPYSLKVGMRAQDYQLNLTISTIPWAIKGFIGVFSDCFALFGYEKKYYMIISASLGSLSCLILLILPYSATKLFFLTPGLLLLWIHLEGACLDLLCEGKYVVKMRDVKSDNVDVVTYIWFCQTVGSLVPSLTIGPLSDFTDPKYCYLIAFPFLFQPLIFLFANCMIDDKVPSHLANKWNVAKWRKEKKLMYMSLILGFLIFGTILLAIIGNPSQRLIYAIVISILLCSLAFYLLPLHIAFGNLYIFIIRILYINISGPIETFYMATPECLENGPHFQFVFFRTYTSMTQNFFSFFGLYLFQLYISKWHFRPAFWVTTLMKVIASIFDIIIVERLNTKIGIPDHFLYLVGDSMILEIANMMDFMPMNLLIAKLCPPSVETSMYAILAGFMNFGSDISSYLGIFLSDLFKIDSLPISEDGTPCNFSNLTLLIIIGHLILPLFSIPLTFILIPNARINDDLSTFNEKLKISKTTAIE